MATVPREKHRHGFMRLRAGESYINGHGDVCGPLVARSGMFLDQHGAVYWEDGCQSGHVPDSAGNFVSRVGGSGA